MSKSICAVPNPSGPLPNIDISLTCEGDHGMFPPQPTHYIGGDYIALMGEASAAGWRKRGDRLLGPCCSGKPPLPF